MRPTDISFLAKACGGSLKGKAGNVIRDVKIDSRACAKGDLFVCVKGENNNGHRYAGSAYELGCRAFLVSEPVEEKPDASYIYVEDTQVAFREMASAYLEQFSPIRIGITGSVGKTTTKMLTAAVMSSKYNTVCTQKNLNTQLGLCLTCFLADETTECIVFEMGMDRKNEIAEYVEWVRPQLAVITNVGVSHMEKLGSRDAIASAKLEIVNKFTEDSVLVINSFSDYLRTKEEVRKRALSKSNFKIVSVGQDLAIEELENLGADGTAFSVGGVRVRLPLLGEHCAVDACLAIAAGAEFGITTDMAAEALAGVSAQERRLSAERIGGVTLIDDSYNASPDSVKAGLEVLASMPAKRRIAALGDMLELGDAEISGHEAVGRRAAELGIDLLIAAGKRHAYYANGASKLQGSTEIIEFETADEAAEKICGMIREGDAVLVKGSNSSGISKLAQRIRNM